jgi:hypothetical protein
MALPAWFWCYGSAATASGPLNDHLSSCRFCGREVEVIDGLIGEHGAVELLPWDGRSMDELVLSRHWN